MSDESISYAELLKAFSEHTSVPDIVRYEVADDGVVYLIGSHGQVTGMTTQVGLQYLLKTNP